LIGVAGFLALQRENGQALAKVLIYPVMGITFVLTVYLFCGWAAWVSARAMIYSSHPSVEYAWLYYVVGFFVCHGPFGWMAAKENSEDSSGHLCIFLRSVDTDYCVAWTVNFTNRGHSLLSKRGHF
jgi:hypothetical protein